MIGSGRDGEITFLDLITIISFVVGVLNLDSNATQTDQQRLMRKFDDNLERLLNEIHGHLQEQDRKIDRILEVLENDSR